MKSHESVSLLLDVRSGSSMTLTSVAAFPHYEHARNGEIGTVASIHLSSYVCSMKWRPNSGKQSGAPERDHPSREVRRPPVPDITHDEHDRNSADEPLRSRDGTGAVRGHPACSGRTSRHLGLGTSPLMAEPATTRHEPPRGRPPGPRPARQGPAHRASTAISGYDTPTWDVPRRTDMSLGCPADHPRVGLTRVGSAPRSESGADRKWAVRLDHQAHVKGQTCPVVGGIGASRPPTATRSE
jgi:hypothetical protein